MLVSATTAPDTSTASTAPKTVASARVDRRLAGRFRAGPSVDEPSMVLPVSPAASVASERIRACRRETRAPSCSRLRSYRARSWHRPCCLPDMTPRCRSRSRVVSSSSARVSPSTSKSTSGAREQENWTMPTMSSRRSAGAARSKSPRERADELLREMTLEEKAMQLTGVYPMALFGPEGPIREQLEAQLGRGIGHVSGLGTMGHKAPEVVAKTVNAIQRYLVTETRLGIPAIFHNEALNGVVSPGFTHFPTAIALAATWDPPAIQQMADLQRRQLRAVGLTQALSPVMDVARDARWGRVHETFGEDPYLVTADRKSTRLNSSRENL